MLKNQNIAKANPNAIANRAFIDALYLERYNRKATEAEYNQFKTRTVKDAANIVLGANDSPFSTQKTSQANIPITSQQPVQQPVQRPAQPIQPLQPASNQATLISPDGKYKIRVNIGSNEASQLQGKGWKVGKPEEIVGKQETDYNTAINLAPKPEEKPEEKGKPEEEITEEKPASGTTKLYDKDGNEIIVDISDVPYYTEDGKYSTVDPQTDINKQNAYALIDASGLSPEFKQLLKDTYDLYPSDSFDVNEIVNTFNKITNETIDPYYSSQIKFATDQLNTAVQDLNIQRQIEVEKEAMSKVKNIKEAQQSLEAMGQTFGGQAVQALGGLSAYGQQQAGELPTQQPLAGGLYVEGDINKANRLMATSTMARYQQAMKQLGQTVEAQLGSTALETNAVPYYTPSGGVLGKTEEQKQQQYGQTLQDVMNQYIAK